MKEIDIKIEILTETYAGVYTIYEDNKIGCAFYYTDDADFYEKLGQSCSAIMRKIKKIPNTGLLAEVEKTVSTYLDSSFPEDVVITDCNHEIKPIGSESIEPVDRSQRCTTDGKPFDPTTDSRGQQKNYVILCEDERKKGFVRPVRYTYIHVGKGGSEIDPDNPRKHGRKGNGCGVATKMGKALSETYARDPKFYTHTYCAGCEEHLPVNEFVWEDGEVVGS